VKKFQKADARIHSEKNYIFSVYGFGFSSCAISTVHAPLSTALTDFSRTRYVLRYDPEKENPLAVREHRQMPLV
jgi:hypothetical protein